MPSASYYRYNDPTGSALNNVAATPASYDELINGPRVFTYKPTRGTPSHHQQGLAHPAPIYHAYQPQLQPQMGYYPQPTYSSPPPEQPQSYQYYSLHRAAYAASPDTPMGYYYSQPSSCYQTNQYASYPSIQYGQQGCYQSHPPPSSNYPGYPYPAQASRSTQLPDGTTLFTGRTKEQVMWENQQIAQNTGANDPVQMVPYKAAAGQQFWCRELDGAWTLRTVNETMGDLQPGYWDKSQSGNAIFIRQKP